MVGHVISVIGCRLSVGTIKPKLTPIGITRGHTSNQQHRKGSGANANNEAGDDGALPKSGRDGNLKTSRA